MPAASYATPAKGASLLLAFRPVSRTFLIIGANKLAAVRAFAALEADAQVLVAAAHPLFKACEEVQWRVQQQQIQYIELQGGRDFLTTTSNSTEEDAIIELLDKIPDLSLLCIVDTLFVDSSTRRTTESVKIIQNACRTRHIPVNVTDIPSLCDYTFPSTQRFSSTTTNPSPGSDLHEEQEVHEPPSLQFAVTTNGQGCRLGARIRREIATKLHPRLGDAVANIGRLRDLARKGQSSSSPTSSYFTPQTPRPLAELDDETGSNLISPLNSPVPQYTSGTVIATAAKVREEPSERVLRRMRWVNQISEYWPIERLAELDEKEMNTILENAHLKGNIGPQQTTDGSVKCRSRDAAAQEPGPAREPSRHDLVSFPEVSPHSQGQILLVGSGPGHPSMLTVAAHRLLTSTSFSSPLRVLSDKLVPAEVLSLIPPGVPLYIAKKYPGNSEGAQNELMEMAVEAALRGETVVRLKQGDPFLYGRGGEEVLYFRSKGFEPTVVPGISSSLAGPLFAGIPVTQRGVAESLTICTGVGRAQKIVTFPPYSRERTLVVLMGVARLENLLKALRNHDQVVYPDYLPIAIVERASSPDQRVIAATLKTIERALESVGEQRTPGMIVVGWVVLALEGTGDLRVLDDPETAGSRDNLEAIDHGRVDRWLAGRHCVVRDGLAGEWRQFI